MRRETVIVIFGTLIVGGLVAANLWLLEGDKAEAVSHADNSGSGVERRVLKQEPTAEQRLREKRVTGGTTARAVQNSWTSTASLQTASEILAQAQRVNEAYKRSAGKAAQEAARLFGAADLDNYFREAARRKADSVRGTAGGSVTSDEDAAGELAEAFVRWIESDPEAATEWAVSQNLQPVMTTLLRDGAEIAVAEAREASIAWIDGIQNADLKEVAAWNFTEAWVRQDPAGGKSFLEGTDWLSPHEKVRVETLAQK